jgi:hypothetical protein
MGKPGRAGNSLFAVGLARQNHEEMPVADVGLELRRTRAGAVVAGAPLERVAADLVDALEGLAGGLPGGAGRVNRPHRARAADAVSARAHAAAAAVLAGDLRGGDDHLADARLPLRSLAAVPVDEPALPSADERLVLRGGGQSEESDCGGGEKRFREAHGDGGLRVQ